MNIEGLIVWRFQSSILQQSPKDSAKVYFILLSICQLQFLSTSKSVHVLSWILILLSVNTRVLSTATLTVEEVYRDRDQFASLVREVAGMDVGRMGIEILSFTIKVSQFPQFKIHIPKSSVFSFHSRNNIW